MLRPFWKPAAMLLALSLLVAACADDSAEPDPDEATSTTDDTADESPEDVSTDDSESVSGTVNLDGSSTVGPLSEVAAELYMQENPDVRVTVAISGTGGGFEKFCIGETDANNSSRPIKDEEIEICEENGIGYDFVTVANDALTALVNNDFPVDCLSVDQLNAIWDQDSSVSTWGDVPDADFPEDFAGQPVQLYGPGTDSGTLDYWTEVINGEEGRIRNDYVDIGEDDNAAVTAVRGDAAAMGYVPYSYFQEVVGEVKALEIDNGDGCIEATAENVANETYAPLGRGLFVYFSDTALARPEALDFAEFYVDNAVEIAELAEFIALTDEQIETARAKIAELAGS